MSDGDAKIAMLPLPDWPDMDLYTEAEEVRGLATTHLPDNVVANRFVVALWVGTAVDNPRIGSIQAQFVFGDRVNPTDLTADEAEYVQKVLEMFVRKVRAT